MATEIKMPQLGESVVEGTITRWLKQEGDTISEDELLVEISTDKVDSEVPSSASGVIQKILVPEGETVRVGTPIVVIGEEGEAAGGEGAASEKDEAPEAAGDEASDEDAQRQQPAAAEAGAEQPAAEEKQQPAAEDKQQPATEQKQKQPAAQAEQPAAGGRDGQAKQPATSGGGPAAEATHSDTQAAPKPSGDTSKRGIISPLVRRLAEEHDVNLDELEGTGTGGRIRKQDVLRFVEERKSRPAAEKAPAAAGGEQAAEAQPAREPAAATPRAAGEREELVPWTNIRRRTAEHMVASHLETARAWNAVEADWTTIVKLRERAKEKFRALEGFNLTYMPFLAKAVCETLLEMPEVNATYDEQQQGNVIKRYVNLGIAVALEGGGLIVPVVQGADEKNIVGLARGINDVANRARSKKLSPDDLAGGTFTITNPGPFGSVISVPIIPRGQTAILGFEAIQKRVVATDDDSFAIRSMGFLSMSWDHRAIDGAEAARFLARLRERIETTDFSDELSQYV